MSDNIDIYTWVNDGMDRIENPSALKSPELNEDCSYYLCKDANEVINALTAKVERLEGALKEANQRIDALLELRNEV